MISTPLDFFIYYPELKEPDAPGWADSLVRKALLSLMDDIDCVSDHLAIICMFNPFT